MKLYFVRHGESVANVLHVFSNSGIKHPLTEKGIDQARQLAVRLADKKISRIFSSPVLRAMQTADILGRSLEVGVRITEALREWSVGILENTSDPQGWELQRQLEEDWFTHRQLERKITGGESFLEIRNRFVPFVEDLMQNPSYAGENIALVGHGGLYIAMLPVLFKNICHADSFIRMFPNTGYALGIVRPDGLYCTEWCGMILPA